MNKRPVKIFVSIFFSLFAAWLLVDLGYWLREREYQDAVCRAGAAGADIEIPETNTEPNGPLEVVFANGDGRSLVIKVIDGELIVTGATSRSARMFFLDMVKPIADRYIGEKTEVRSQKSEVADPPGRGRGQITDE